jgi:heme/copper-type cytochrome/quinol oxidase subunit 2
VEVDYIEQLKYDVLLEEKSIELYAKWNIDEVYNEIDIDTGNEKEIVNKRVDKTLIVGICIIFILLLILIICIIRSRKKENDFNSY